MARDMLRLQPCQTKALAGTPDGVPVGPMYEVHVNGTVVLADPDEALARRYAAGLARNVADTYPADAWQARQVTELVAGWLEKGVISGVRPYRVDPDNPVLPDVFDRRDMERVVIEVKEVAR